MASAGGIRAGRAFVEFFAEKSPLVRGMRAIEKDVSAFGKRLTSIGAGIFGVGAGVAAAFTPMIAAFAAAGDAVSKMSQRTGAGVESLQVLGYASESAGASIGDIEGAIGKVSGDVASLAKGNFEVADSYAKWGVNLGSLMNLKPEQRFAVLAERISQIKNPTMQAAAATDLLGGSAAQLLPLLKQGGKGLADASSRARELGIVMDSKTATAGESLTQAFYDMKSAAAGLWNQIGAALAPVVTDLANRAAGFIAVASKWVANNQAVIVTVAKVAVGVAAVGAALIAAGATISALGGAIGIAATAVTAIGAGLAFLISPIGLAIAAVAGLATAFFTLTDVGKSAASAIGDAVGELVDRFRGYWQGIYDAIASGDIALAGKIAFLALQVEWMKVVEVVKSVWRGVTTFILDAWDVVTSGIASKMVDASATLKSAWTQVTAFLQDAWIVSFQAMANVASGILDAIMVPVRALADAISQVTGVDVSGLIAKFDSVKAAAIGSLNTGAELAIGQSDRKRRSDLQQIEQDRQTSKATIAEGLQGRISGRATANQAAADAGQAGISGVQDQLAAAQEEAFQAARAAKIAALEKKGVTAASVSKADGSGSLGVAAKGSVSGAFQAAAAAKISGTSDPLLSENRTQTGLLRQIANAKATFS